MDGSPLLIYHHLPKSGGISLRVVVRENFAPGEVAELYDEVAALHSHGAATGMPVDEQAWYRNWYRSLADEERRRIKCVASHTANQLIPALDRPFRAFCLLRDPVEHVWSLYHYVQYLAEREGSRGRGAESGRELTRRGWKLADIYRELGDGNPASSALHDRFRGFFNGQARSIRSPWEDQSALAYWAGIPGHGEGLRDAVFEILDRHYVVGVHEQYARSLQRFAAAFGWTHLEAPHLNRSAPRARPDPETRALIETYNGIDADLHAYFYAEMAGPG